jgi:hypothetical protein
VLPGIDGAIGVSCDRALVVVRSVVVSVVVVVWAVAPAARGAAVERGAPVDGKHTLGV